MAGSSLWKSRNKPLCPKSGKLMHNDFYEASRHLRRLARRQLLDGLRCYKCMFCLHWHVGHNRKVLDC